MKHVVAEAEVYEQAADLIDQRGWAQGQFVDCDGKICAEGALNLAAFGEVDPWSGEYRWTEVSKHIGEQVGKEYGCICDWQDETGRRQEEVTATLRDYAKVLRAKDAHPASKSQERRLEAMGLADSPA